MDCWLPQPAIPYYLLNELRLPEVVLAVELFYESDEIGTKESAGFLPRSRDELLDEELFRYVL
jgi:hypothetical protein